jgi:hypothetical protein
MAYKPSADELVELIAEQERRAGRVTGENRSTVAYVPEKTTTLEETKRAVTALLKGSTKGIIDLIGGWGNLYDVIKENKDPSALSSRGIVNAIAKAGGPDLMKLQGYKGMYDIGQAGAPMAVMSAMAPGSSLFNLSTPARTAAAEFTTAGGLGLASQQVAPESMGAQAAMQTLPYLVKGGVTGLRSKAQQDRINEYKSMLPPKDANIFEEFMLRGQGSSDPVIAADIARLSRSPKYLELIANLNEGAAKKAVMGMEPRAVPLTAEESKVGIIQGIQNKLDKIRDSGASSLFERAKELGAGKGIVDPTITLTKIDALIKEYSSQLSPNAKRAVEVLQGIRDRLQPTQSAVYGAKPSSTFTVREGTEGFTSPAQPGGVRIVERQVPTFDSLGTPTGMKTVREEVPFSGTPSATYAGTPATMGTNPASAGTNVSWQNAPNQLTVEQIQGMLSEFGKKASAGDNLIKDLSISAERRISSAIFGGLKDDLVNAAQTASGNDRAALNLLSAARDKVAKSSTAYREAIAQGMPAFLHDKTIAEISPEKLFETYKGLTPTQRATMRSWVEESDPLMLRNLDKQVFDDFVKSARKENALGVETVDLASLAKNWRSLSTIDKDALTTALGIKTAEFEQRMKDAELMTRKMSVAQPTNQPMIGNEAVRETSAVLGASAGYGASKIGQLSLDLVNAFTKNGLTDDQLMKALLTPEGANFLKTASMSPRSAAVLDNLTKMENSNPVVKWAAGTTARVAPRMASAEQPTVQTEEQVTAGQDELAALLEEQARRQQEQQPMQPQQ